MSEIKINSINLNSDGFIKVHLTVDNNLQLHIKITPPTGPQEEWTIGEIKKLAIKEAKSRIPT